jgi:hypothetical protein
LSLLGMIVYFGDLAFGSLSRLVVDAFVLQSLA